MEARSETQESCADLSVASVVPRATTSRKPPSEFAEYIDALQTAKKNAEKSRATLDPKYDNEEVRLLLRSTRKFGCNENSNQRKTLTKFFNEVLLMALSRGVWYNNIFVFDY